MASIVCTNCNALLKTARDIAPGSTMKCPRCNKSFIVEEEEDDEPQGSSCLSTILTTLFLLLVLCCSGAGLGTW